MKRNAKQRDDVRKQQRAEHTAAAIRMRAAGATLRTIGAELGLSAPTVMRLLREAPTTTVEAAVTAAASTVRNRQQIVDEHNDILWRAMQPNLEHPAVAAVAFRTVELEARLGGLIVNPSVAASQGRALGIRIVDTASRTVSQEMTYVYE